MTLRHVRVAGDTLGDIRAEQQDDREHGYGNSDADDGYAPRNAVVMVVAVYVAREPVADGHGDPVQICRVVVGPGPTRDPAVGHRGHGANAAVRQPDGHILGSVTAVPFHVYRYRAAGGHVEVPERRVRVYGQVRAVGRRQQFHGVAGERTPESEPEPGWRVARRRGLRPHVRRVARHPIVVQYPAIDRLRRVVMEPHAHRDVARARERAARHQQRGAAGRDAVEPLPVAQPQAVGVRERPVRRVPVGKRTYSVTARTERRKFQLDEKIRFVQTGVQTQRHRHPFLSHTPPHPHRDPARLT